MLAMPNWLNRLLGKKPLSKNAKLRLAHSVVYYDGLETGADGRERPVRRTRMLMRYLDRSKYEGDGTRK